MRKLRDILILIVLVAIVARIVWWALEPFLPAVLVGIGLIFVFGVIIGRGRGRSW